MTKVMQTPADLERHLQEQIGFLRRSAGAYDQGHVDEAKRLAVTIRVLVQDSRASRSLLGQLGEKARMFYVTAVRDEPGNKMPYGGLIHMAMGSSGGMYLPNLDDMISIAKPNWVSFDEWWNRPIFRNDDGKVLTRSDLVRSVADQDGGAHVDPGLNEVYERLSRGSGMGWTYKGPAGAQRVRVPELAAIRQIAHEVMKTFDPSYIHHPNRSEKLIHFGAPVFREATQEEISEYEHQQRMSPHSPATIVKTSPKIGRNDPCPCGSGVKYKKCHGRT